MFQILEHLFKKLEQIMARGEIRYEVQNTEI